MATIKHIFKGESLSMLFTFPADYDMSRIQSHGIWIGRMEFTGVIIGQGIELKLTSLQTDLMSGNQRVSLWIDDTILGVRKPYVGDIAVGNTNALPDNESTSEVYDVIVNVDISVTSIEAGDLMFNYVKGDKGDTGKYGETKFVINDNMELEQHTLIGDPLNFSLVDDELVLTEDGETVNLGTVAIKDTYSYDEQMIGTWVNGKPIYRKVFLLLTNEVVEDIQIVHNLGIELYIHSDIVSNYIDGDNSPSTPLFTGQYQTTSILLAQNNISMYGFHSEPNFTYHLIIEYTKL